MALTRWEPFENMDDLFGRLPGTFGRWPRLSGAGIGVDWTPSVDISETTDEYLVKANLPGVAKEDAKVTFHDNLLTISGERKQEKREDKGERYHRVESFHGTFSRSFALPDTIDAAAIKAETKDGVLIVHVPKKKAEVKQPAEIKIQ